MNEKRKGAVVLTIDDGSEDNYRLFQMLARYGVPATFNIITERIEREKYLSMRELVEIYHHPLMEIAAHSHSHKNDFENVKEGNEHLFAWLGIEERKIGFASPGSKMTRDFVLENADALREMGLVYVRSSANPDPSEHQIALVRELTERGASEWVAKNACQLIYAFTDMYIPSAVVYQHTTLDELKALADLAEREGACILMMLHRVEKPDEEHWENLWCFDYDTTEAFVRYLKEKEQNGSLDLLTTRDAFQKFSV